MRRPGLLALALATGGCRPGPGPSEPAPPRDAPTAAKDPGKSADLEDSCGRGHETFADHGWTPVDVRLVASIRLDAADLDPALAHLERAARQDRSGLPITAGFTLSQLRLEVSILRQQLAAAGFRPDELVRLASADGIVAWVFPTRCDLAEAKLRAGAAWKLDLRITTDGSIGEPRPGADPPFPYNVLFLPDDRVALVPTDRADAGRAWLRRRHPPDPAADLPGARLDDLAHAAVRVVFGGHGFLSGEPGDAPPGTLRATDEGVWIDGSLRPPP